MVPGKVSPHLMLAGVGEHSEPYADESDYISHAAEELQRLYFLSQGARHE